MMDIMTGISAISETLKITKELRSIDREIDKAQLKLRLSDMIDSLLKAKEALQDAKQERSELLSRIEELQGLMRRKENLEDEFGCLFELDENGQRRGEPYCNHCFVKGEKLYRLRPQGVSFGYGYYCDNCGKSFGLYRKGPQLTVDHDSNPYGS